MTSGARYIVADTKYVGTVAEMKADTSAAIGDRYYCDDYAAGNNAGELKFLVVAAGTGVDDGGSYIDHNTLNAQFKQLFSDFITVKKFGAGTGLTEAANTTAIGNAIVFGNTLDISGGVYPVDYLHFSTAKKITGNGTLKVTGLSEKVLGFSDNGAIPVENVHVKGLKFEQPHDPAMSGGTNNNHFSLKFIGANNCRAENLTFNDVDLAFSVGYGSITLADRASYYCSADNLKGENIAGMGIQIFGSNHGTYKNMRFHGKSGTGRALFAGVRMTGYSFANNCNNLVNATIDSFNEGISIQCYSFNNNVDLSARNCDVGIQVHGASEGRTLADVSSGNSIKATIDGCVYGIYDGGVNNIFDVNIENCTYRGIYQQNNGGISGMSKGSTFRGTVKNCDDRLVDINGTHNNFDLVLIGKGSSSTGFGFLCNGSYNSGKLVIDACSTGLRINGQYNSFQASINNCTTALYVAGDNNTINISTEGNVYLAGNNNVLRGYVGGTITNTGTRNDYSNLSGNKYIRRYFSQSTDGSGYLTLTHNLGKTNVANVEVLGSNYATSIQGVNSNSVTIKLYDNAGTVITNATGLTVDLSAQSISY
jgi:hypothetical protein